MLSSVPLFGGVTANDEIRFKLTLESVEVLNVVRLRAGDTMSLEREDTVTVVTCGCDTTTVD